MFSKIYDLTYHSILTPSNLLDNLKLDNYTNLNYSKKDGFTVCEIKCLVDGEQWEFYYTFDQNDHLQLAYYIEDDQRFFLFNRKEELQKLREEFEERQDILQTA